MKKDYYYIMKYKGNSYGVELARGFIDDNMLYGYRYIREPKKSSWECTDLESGLLVTARKTIDECVKYTIDYKQNIDRIRETTTYKDCVAIFERAIKAQQMKDDAKFNAGW